MPSLTSFIQSLKDHKNKVPETIEEQVNKLGSKFGGLVVASEPETPTHKPSATTQPASHFSGGFHPTYSTDSSNQPRPNTLAHNGGRPSNSPAQTPAFPVPAQYPTSPGPLPRPPSMSSHKRHDSGTQEISNTLMYAMQGILATPYPAIVDTPIATIPPNRLQAPYPPSRPYSDPAVPRYQDAQLSSTPPSRPPPSTPQRPHYQAPPPATVPSKSNSSTKTDSSSNSPSRGRRRNSSTSSLPSTLTSKNGAVRCSGVTKSGSQCKNMVKDSAALGALDPDEHETMKRYCHIHTDQIKKSGGYLSNNVQAPFDSRYRLTLVKSSLTLFRSIYTGGLGVTDSGSIEDGNGRKADRRRQRGIYLHIRS